ncbi:hypothetical protein FNJ88_11070 [Chryseobacterium sp. SNU WT5]|uniref:hypothetical protein n=1 Tax=Chryseobacterium sp. SNU WT5 TaxID=2594269 RepID=UPI00117C83B6|nr:hypothetical protein [Chryseobacterium sp. SNU WT5]QDP86060.1 hypothetical protein FNJ88_11070 [Chryseobacterium sp. SNU WT5]
MSKASTLEKEKRIQSVMGWIISGMPTYKLLKKVKDTFKVENRQARRYINEAFNRWKPEADENIESKRHARIDELKEILTGMSAANKKTPAGIRTILAVKKEMSKLENLYPAKRFIHSNDPDNPLPENSTQVSIFQIPENNR